MADDLRWVNVTAIPGIDATTADQLLQPRSRTGPALARRAVGMESYSKRGTMVPDRGYSLYAIADADQGLIGRIKGGTFAVHAVWNGVVWRQSGGSWVPAWNTEAVPAIPTLHATNRVRMVSAFGAVFCVDGSSKPRVIGWNYDPADPGQKTPLAPSDSFEPVDTVSFLDTTNEVCEILNTRGSQGSNFAPDLIAVHMSRLVLIKGSEVRLSAAYMPCVFYDPNDPTVGNSFFYVEEGNGEDITGAVSYDGKILMVCKPNSLHAYAGTDPAADYARVVIDASKGLHAPDSLCLGFERVWGCSSEGPWWFSSDSGLEDRFGGAIRAIWDSMSLEEKRQVVGWFEEGRYHLVLPIKWTDIDYEVPDNAFVRLSYDPVLKTWTEGWSVHGTTARMHPVSGDDFTLTARDGALWTQRSGFTLQELDENEEIVEYEVMHEIELPWFDAGDAERYKWYRRLMIRMLSGPTAMIVEYGLNYQAGWSRIDVELPSPSRKWGEGKWGEGKWVGQGTIDVDLPLTLHARAVRLRFRAPMLKIQSVSLGFDYEVV